jgi:hypothetical protein
MGSRSRRTVWECPIFLLRTQPSNQPPTDVEGCLRFGIVALIRPTDGSVVGGALLEPHVRAAREDEREEGASRHREALECPHFLPPSPRAGELLRRGWPPPLTSR